MAQSDKIEYSVVEGWEQLPKDYVHRDVAGVAVDGEDRVYLICRGDHPVMVYDQKGNFKRSWGEGEFTYRTHGIYVAPNGTIFCTDDGNHTVRQFTPEGKLLMTLGIMNTPSDTGYDGKNLDTIKRGAGPFNRPTNIAIGPNGDFYISDGYGNARVHRFSPTGQLKRSWGEPGRGPGQFHLPHGIAVAADGRVFVCDRESDRIQIFSPDGEYLSEWTDTQRPTHLVFDAQGRAYVTELWWHEGDKSYTLGPITKARHARVSVFDPSGKVLARWGTPDATAPGSFAAPHGLAIDSKNDLYVSEVTWTFAVSHGRVPADCHTFQKFALKV
jgi:DNA-binding beta-propeller fold protein YncE